MAGASRILQTTLISTFSQNPSQYTLKAHSHHYIPPSTSKRSSLFHRIRCSVSTTSTGGESATGTTVPWGCDVESLENASALQEWLSKCGLPPQKMAIQRVDVGERGLVALKNIRKGEKLLFVPPSLFITADSKNFVDGLMLGFGSSIELLSRSLELDNVLPQLSIRCDFLPVVEVCLFPILFRLLNQEWSCREAGEVLKQYNVPDWPLLATYLISEAGRMNSSRWSNYISALPRQPYSLLYWTRAELDRYLEASEIRQRAIERINDVTGTYSDLRDRIFSKYPELFPDEVFNMESFKWSFGILFSRLVRLPSMDGKVALVPWADMLNHSCEVETFLDYDKSSQELFSRLIEHISQTPHCSLYKFKSFHINMERNPTGSCCFRMDFREGTNPRDSVELSLSLKKSDKCYKEKLEALKKHGLSASECFPIQITGWPVELMAYAYLTVSPPSMKNRFDEMAAAASNKTTSKKDVVYPEIEEEALQFILDMCEASISKYSKFLQASKWFDGFGRDKSEASEPKTVLETASCGFMYQRTEDTLSRTICKDTLNLRSLVTVFIHFKQCRRLTRRAGGKSLSYN
ncbi:UNVERIFIED_CONTAM: Ribulose-1,5 bisphosphate carboxylase/oxygenase large subunit N-methyltransferase, chloroplastic [Sesamum radiatum]|uniref:Ribulose-1,5 bisphosphate carboxylase/oxygenase large subunit N-methyltransferase, chloroplastic n=1 Tax=Sesamum radiatum TaxID=300843 RepID=A0AAW2KM82_SESRA